MLVENVASDEGESLLGKRVRLYTDDGMQEMRVKKVDFPYIEGTTRPPLTTTTIRVDLREVQRIEILRNETGKRMRWIIPVVLVVGLLGIVALVALDEALD